MEEFHLSPHTADARGAMDFAPFSRHDRRPRIGAGSDVSHCSPRNRLARRLCGQTFCGKSRHRAYGLAKRACKRGHVLIAEPELCVCRWIETTISGYGPLSTDSASGESHNAVEYCAQLIPDALSLWTG